MKDPIVERVIEQFKNRSNVGIEKYKTTLFQNNTDDFFKHLQEELMDGVNYIEKIRSDEYLPHLYKYVIDRYIDIFCKKQEVFFEFWVGKIDYQTACFGDYVIDFNDIKYDIDANIPKGIIFEWYNVRIDDPEIKYYNDLNNYLKDRIMESQFIEIPDVNFFNALVRMYPDATAEGQMLNVKHRSIVNEKELYVSRYKSRYKINDLTGIEYFVGLESLDCYHHNLTTLPTLPSGLKSLYCSDNKLTTLPELPSTLEILDCSNNDLITLPTLPSSLKDLYCSNNDLITLPTLPSSLKGLHCSHNKLTTINELPSTLRILNCSYNSLKTLPELPNGLLVSYYKNPLEDSSKNF